MRVGGGGVLFNDRRFAGGAVPFFFHLFVPSDGVDGVVGFWGCFNCVRSCNQILYNEVCAHIHWIVPVPLTL